MASGANIVIVCYIFPIGIHYPVLLCGIWYAYNHADASNLADVVTKVVLYLLAFDP